VKTMPRYVSVDMGYQTAEGWQRAKVIKSEVTKGLFGIEEKEILLVELPSGKLVWVDYWKEEQE